MSRKTWDNREWHFVAGADRVTSSFFELWRQPWEEQDCPVLMANNTGIAVYEEEGLPTDLLRAIKDLRSLYELARRLGNPYPNLDWAHVSHFARIADFHIERELADLYS